MQLFTADAIVFSIDPERVKKLASKVAHNWPRPFYFTVQPRPTARSPELIFHNMRSHDQTSVLLSVIHLIFQKRKFSTVLIIDRQSSHQKIRQKFSVIKTNSSDDIKKIVHFGILIHILS